MDVTEQKRLNEAREAHIPWKKCGPYFHGDNGAGLGASHQTGWTGVVARLLDLFGRVEAKDLEMELGHVSARLVREQVGRKKQARR